MLRSRPTAAQRASAPPAAPFAPSVVDAVDQPGSFWAKVTGQAAGTNRYAWEAVNDGDTDAFDSGLADDFTATGTSDEGGSPAYEINGRTDVEVGTRVRVWPAGDLTYYLFAFGGSSGPPTSGTKASGCGWVAGLVQADCLELSVIAGSGRCAALAPATAVRLTSTNGTTWTGSVTLGGVAYAASFTAPGCHGPCLTLTGPGGSAVTYTGTREGCGSRYAVFAFGGGLCTGGADDCTDNVLRVRVSKVACVWDGPGWYCVKDCPGGACEAVELLEGDQYRTDLAICSGPYEDEAEAGANCGPVVVCCADTTVPRTVSVTFSGVLAYLGTRTFTWSHEAGGTNWWYGDVTGLLDPCGIPFSEMAMNIACQIGCFPVPPSACAVNLYVASAGGNWSWGCGGVAAGNVTFDPFTYTKGTATGSGSCHIANPNAGISVTE